jgi:membrane protease YdiL (CAAX protease family)
MEHAMTTQTLHLSVDTRPTVLQRHPVGTFLALTYAASWAIWLPLIVLRDRMAAGPALLLLVLGSNVPSAVALLLVARLHGRAGVKRLLRRLLPARVGILVYAAIFALTALAVAAVWLSTFVGIPAPEVAVTVPGLLSIFLFSIFPGSATGEELGWRGFALHSSSGSAPLWRPPSWSAPRGGSSTSHCSSSDFRPGRSLSSSPSRPAP